MQKNSIRLILLGILSLITFGLDQLSKIYFDSKMEIGESWQVIKNFFSITYVRNPGVVFGLFSDYPWIFWLVSVLGLGVIVSIVNYIIKNISEFSMYKLVAYGLIFGGAIGNTYDRFARGFVIDFIDFHGIWSFIFNIADTAINIGIILLLIDSYLVGIENK